MARKSNSAAPSTSWMIGGAIVAIAGAGAAAYFFYNRSSQAEGLKGLAGTIPTETEVAFVIDTQPQLWQKLQQFGTPDSQKIVQEAMRQSPLNALLTQSKTDLGKDVQPWLGSPLVTALVRDPQQPRRAPATLLVAPTRDRDKSTAFLTRYRNALSQQGAKFSEKTYKDFKYYESPTRDAGQSVITADIGGKYVVIATSSQLVQRMFDLYQNGGPSLATKPNFATLLAPQTAAANVEPIARMYLDGAIALEFLGTSAKMNLSEPMLSQSRKELDVMTAIAGIQKEGIRLEVTTYLKSGGTQEKPPTPSTLLPRLPKETFFLISGFNLERTWQSLSAQAKANSASEQVPLKIREGVQSLLKLDLEKDILPWLNGEFAIAGIATKQGILKTAGYGLVAIAETSDRGATQKLLKKLDELARTSTGGVLPTGAEIDKRQLDGKEITRWKVSSSKSSLIFAEQGFIDDRHAFWAMGELANALLPIPTSTLADSSAFQILTTGLPKTNGGYFYLNITEALPIFDENAPASLKSNPVYMQAKALLDAIRGIAVTTIAVDNRTTRLDFLFTLKPTPGN